MNFQITTDRNLNDRSAFEDASPCFRQHRLAAAYLMRCPRPIIVGEFLSVVVGGSYEASFKTKRERGMLENAIGTLPRET